VDLGGTRRIERLCIRAAISSRLHAHSGWAIEPFLYCVSFPVDRWNKCNFFYKKSTDLEHVLHFVQRIPLGFFHKIPYQRRNMQLFQRFAAISDKIVVQNETLEEGA